MTRGNDHDDNSHMTRAEYRRESKWREHRRLFRKPAADQQSTDQLGGDEETRTESVQSSGADDTVSNADDDKSVDTGQTRAASLQSDKQALAKEKRQRLGKRLNITIAVLVVLIVIVYLILFFVG